MKLSVRLGLYSLVAASLLVLVYILRSTGSNGSMNVTQHITTTALADVNDLEGVEIEPVDAKKLSQLKTQNTETLFDKIDLFEKKRSVQSIDTTSVEAITEKTYECLAKVYHTGQRDTPQLVTTTYRYVNGTFVLSGIIY